MKVTIKELRSIIRQVVQETAAEGVFQKKAKQSVSSMVNTVTTKGGNKNTKPFTVKASKPGKSGPDDSEYTQS